MSAPSASDFTTGCNGHTGLPDEFRTMALAALDRLAPTLERMRVEQAAAGEPGVAAAGQDNAADRPCAVCPICAVIAAWRGERSELAARVVDHAAGLLAVLRAALDEGVGAPAAADESAPRHGPSAPRPVQHISVHR